MAPAKLFIFSLLLPLSQQCTSRSNDVTKKVDNEEESIIPENPFRRHIEQHLVKKKFNPPKKVLYGFKPVNLLNTFLDDVPGPPYKEDLPLEKSDTEDMLYAEENDVYKMYLTHDAYKDRVEKNNPIKSNMGNIVPKESTNNIEDYEEDMFGQGIFDEFDFPSFNSFEIN